VDTGFVWIMLPGRRLGVAGFEGDWRDAADGGVAALRVVEHLEVVDDRQFRGAVGVEPAVRLRPEQPVSRVAKNASAIELSKQSATDPIDASAPQPRSAISRSREVYSPPRSL
jgi:hypothetical protein